MATQNENTRCSHCGGPIGPGDGLRLIEVPGDRGAAFCRLEHVVPWAIRGPHWEPGAPVEPAGLSDSIDTCARCGEPLGEVHVLLVSHRGDARVPDGFCSVTHLREWAQAGGRYAP